jgi:type II secretory ATPase GspE/PulE/Tfp pilus assembly ATPase PilB-like protein
VNKQTIEAINETEQKINGDIPKNLMSEEEHFAWIDKPQLTETEITILKGRLAEGYTKMNRVSGGIILFNGWVGTSKTDTLFQFIKEGEEYSIEELLKGTEK